MLLADKDIFGLIKLNNLSALLTKFVANLPSGIESSDYSNTSLFFYTKPRNTGYFEAALTEPVLPNLLFTRMFVYAVSFNVFNICLSLPPSTRSAFKQIMPTFWSFMHNKLPTDQRPDQTRPNPRLCDKAEVRSFTKMA